jgi:hypothetical protein
MAQPMLDLQQFESMEDALTKVAPGDRYVDVGRPLVPVGDRIPMTETTMFWFSMIARGQGLHSAIEHEARAHNPHAVFSLLRAFAESVVMLIYVLDHPECVELISVRASELPKGGPKRKSMQGLISAVSKRATGM